MRGQREKRLSNSHLLSIHGRPGCLSLQGTSFTPDSGQAAAGAAARQTANSREPRQVGLAAKHRYTPYHSVHPEEVFPSSHFHLQSLGFHILCPISPPKRQQAKVWLPLAQNCLGFRHLNHCWQARQERSSRPTSSTNCLGVELSAFCTS